MFRSLLTIAFMFAAAAYVFGHGGQTSNQSSRISESVPINAIPSSISSELFSREPAGKPGSTYFYQDQPNPQGGGRDDSGGGAGAAEANNPGAPLSQFQFQNVFIPESYQSHGYANQFVVQPVIAIDRRPDKFFPYHIIRATLPILEPVPDPDGPVPDLGGTGDITYFDLYMRKTCKEGLSWGIGPVVIFPTASNPGLITGDRQTGLGEWQMGPAAVVIDASRKNWIVGALIEIPFSFESNAHSVLMQPILTRLLQDDMYIAIGDLLWKFDDQNGNYNIPLSFRFGKVFKAGKQPINIFLQPEYTPRGFTSQATSKYGLKLSVTFLLPGAKFGYNPERAANRRCQHCLDGCEFCQ